MGAQGKTTIDFGAFPGASDTFADVVAAGVISTSCVEAWIHPAATADHTVDEHMLETLKVFGIYISDGNIRIHGFNTSEIHEPLQRVPVEATPGAGLAIHRPLEVQIPLQGGIGTRLYGLFTVAWVWN
jgi:hypothetical protein